MINIGFISLDIIILIIIILGLFFTTYKIGKKPILALIISVYPATLFFQFFPYIEFDSQKVAAVVFIIVYGFFYYIIQKYINNKKVHKPSRKIVDYGLLSLSYVVLIISISTNHIPALKNLYNFTGLIPDIVNKIDTGIILLIPLIVILITSRGDNH